LKLSIEIPEEYRGKRLDQALAILLSDYSRSRLQRWVREGRVLVDGQVCRPRDIMQGGELVEVDAAETAEKTNCEPEDLPVLVVHEDEDLIVLVKAAGMVVHPAAGNYTGTLQNALLCLGMQYTSPRLFFDPEHISCELRHNLIFYSC